MIFLLLCIGRAAGVLCGDVNPDGEIGIRDAPAVARYTIELDPPEFDETADQATGDG